MSMEDRSGFKPDEFYQCSSCGNVSIGRDLIPVATRELIEVDGKISSTGKIFIGNRVCPHDRGSMKPSNIEGPESEPDERCNKCGRGMPEANGLHRHLDDGLTWCDSCCIESMERE